MSRLVAGHVEDFSTVTAQDGWTTYDSSYQIWTGRNWRECDGSRIFRFTHLKLARALKDRWGGSWLWVGLPDYRGSLSTSGTTSMDGEFA